MLCPMPDRPLDPPESGDDPEEIECECGAIFYPEERISRIVDHSVEHTCPVCGSTEMWLYEPRRDSTVKAIKDIALTFGDDYLRKLWDEETERHNGTPVMLRKQAGESDEQLEQEKLQWWQQQDQDEQWIEEQTWDEK